jgi:hypothetical protein
LNIHGAAEILPRGVGIIALQLVFVGEGDGMDDEIQCAPFLADRGEDRIHRCQILDVTGQNQR